jgi:hypothetical protein
VVAVVPIFVFLQFVELPAVIFLGLWLVMQILGGFSSEFAGGGGWLTGPTSAASSPASCWARSSAPAPTACPRTTTLARGRSRPNGPAHRGSGPNGPAGEKGGAEGAAQQ